MLALTDLATTDVRTKMALCMGATCIAQADARAELWSSTHNGKPQLGWPKVYLALPLARAVCIAQVPLALFGLSYCSTLDWLRAGRVINARANTDKRESMSPPHAPEGGSAPSIAPASPYAAAARGASPLAITPLVLAAADQPSCTRVN